MSEPPWVRELKKYQEEHAPEVETALNQWERVQAQEQTVNTAPTIIEVHQRFRKGYDLTQGEIDKTLLKLKDDRGFWEELGRVFVTV